MFHSEVGSYMWRDIGFAVIGHGGDGGDEPPHPFGGGFGDHQNDECLVAEVALQTHHIADFGGDPNTIDWIAIFEKVLGTQRGHVTSIWHKASSAAGTSAPSQWQSQSQAPQPTQEVDVIVFFS
ncbi:unnamed protein product [Lactuca saligna]|uniref:Uncharacterized protein n=1 Tax=Lactuca saligna TaxID=75948 RepID=A0AA35Y729_LACSI|nr:unnamed protein product [Lactuca saligna]